MLIRCPECGEQISNQAGACPHCGAPVERGQQPPRNMGVVLDSRRARGIILFLALVIVLVDVVLYVAGRLILMSKLRDAFDTFVSVAFSDRTGSAFARFLDTTMAERVLVAWAGDVVLLIIGAALFWAIWQALHLDRAGLLTRWTLGCSVFLGIIVTLVSTWTFWADSYLLLPSSFFPELSASWNGWFSLQNRISTYQPEQWWLIPVLSSVFLICSFIAVAVRAAYVRLFEKK